MTQPAPPLRSSPRTIFASILSAVLLAALAGCSSQANGGEEAAMVVVEASLDRPANPSLASIRFDLENRTDTDDFLIGVSSPDGTASIHRSEVDGEGRARMTPVDRLSLPARSTVEFEPGGLHVMLDGITRDLQVGEVVRVELEFEVNEPLTVDVPVVVPLSAAGDHDTAHRSLPAAPAPPPAGALR